MGLRLSSTTVGCWIHLSLTIGGEDKQADDLTCMCADRKRQMRSGWRVDDGLSQRGI